MTLFAPSRRAVGILGVLVVPVLTLGAGHGLAAAASGVTVTPGGPFTDGETVTVTVGPNGVFTPNARVNVLECADPGGTAANLPTDDSTCDGNTIQGATVLVHSDGSVSAPNYTLYQLPSAALGEQPNFQPVCNQSSPCVLYVGQDQNNFTQPKMFSAPFTVGPAAASTTTTPVGAGSGAGTAGGPASPATGSQGTSTAPGASNGGATGAGAQTAGTAAHEGTTAASGVSADRSAASSGTLAFTGLPADLVWLALLGAILVTVGILVRRASARATR